MAGEKPQAKRVTVQTIPTSGSKTTKRELWATICYYYPQYDLQKASQLSLRDIKLLLRIAKQKEAEKMFYLTQIAAAPHTEKGKGVKQLSDYFKKETQK